MRQIDDRVTMYGLSVNRTARRSLAPTAHSDAVSPVRNEVVVVVVVIIAVIVVVVVVVVVVVIVV